MLLHSIDRDRLAPEESLTEQWQGGFNVYGARSSNTIIQILGPWVTSPLRCRAIAIADDLIIVRGHCVSKCSTRIEANDHDPSDAGWLSMLQQ